MKKFLLCAFFALAMCCTVSAHPIKVTAPDGRVKYFESDDYETMEQLMTAIDAWINNKVTSQPTNPTPSVPANPSVPKK